MPDVQFLTFFAFSLKLSFSVHLTFVSKTGKNPYSVCTSSWLIGLIARTPNHPSLLQKTSAASKPSKQTVPQIPPMLTRGTPTCCCGPPASIVKLSAHLKLFTCCIGFESSRAINLSLLSSSFCWICFSSVSSSCVT